MPRRRHEDKIIEMIVDRQQEQNEDIAELRLEMRALLALPPTIAAQMNTLEGRLKAQEASFDEWKVERRQDLVEIRDDIKDLQEEARTAHHRLAYGKDPETNKPLPPQPAKLTWGTVAQIITVEAAILGPCVALAALFLQ